MPLTPTLELKDDKRWVVEYQKGAQDLVIENPQTKHAVALYKNDNVVLTVKGKVASITIDNCSNTSVIFDTAISSVEIVNSKKIQVQVNNNVPIMSVDKSNGVSLFLSTESLGTSVVSSLSQEINIYVPKNDETLELAVPSQFTTTFDKNTGKLVTVEGNGQHFE